MDWKTRYKRYANMQKRVVRRNGRLFFIRDYSKCWEWKGGRYDSRGYGAFWKDGRTRSATRVGWEFWHGSAPPDDMQICHTCDNPPCQNPKHWFLGSASDNTIDKVNKGRGKTPNGSKHWKSKLTEADVLAIRAEHKGIGVYGENTRLGRKYGVDRETIRGIILRKEWQHI